MRTFETIARKWEAFRPYAFDWSETGDSPVPFAPYRSPHDNAHDDGPYGCFSYGGIGAGNFGRDLFGNFSRWHLQAGCHFYAPMEAAGFNFRWQQGDRVESARVGGASAEKKDKSFRRTVSTLFPVVMEKVSWDDGPIDVLMESYSPVIPQDDEASSLPVVFFDLYVRNRSDSPLEFDAAFFWPNLLGWRPGSSTDTQRTDWDGTVHMAEWWEHCHSGNRNVRASSTESVPEGILFQRESLRAPRRDQEGEWGLFAVGGDGLRCGHDVSFRVSQPGSGQPWTLEQAEKQFVEQGALSGSDFSWKANHDEALGGAVSSGVTLAPGEDSRMTFVLVWDLPLAEFGSGRTWAKAYTKQYGISGNQAQRIAEDAAVRREEWRQKIDDWHQRIICEASNPNAAWQLPPDVCGALINESYYLIDGGTCWVDHQHASNELPEPVLGAGEHIALLEGFDKGYYYYSTYDLYPHAELSLIHNWPCLDTALIKDFIKALPLGQVDERPFYSPEGTCGARLTAGKIPHDIGAAPEDPWHVTNAYHWRIDSNTWKDHNPLFLAGLNISLKKGCLELSADDLISVCSAGDLMLAQDEDRDGLPEHNTAGDSTWDALDLHGPIIYSSGITIAALAALSEIAPEDRQGFWKERLTCACRSFEKHFWTGTYYRSGVTGEFADWVMTDGLFGILLAHIAGHPDLLPADHVLSHLRTVYEQNFLMHDEGKWGPRLLAPPPGKTSAEDAIQVDETLVGSAWSCIGLMYRYGMNKEADEISRSMVRIIYKESGLQFRTPAAWNSRRIFRAPLNMRPLAIWYLKP